MLEEIVEFIESNPNKRFALFSDMDGVLARLNIDVNGDIPKNTPGFFLDKEPIEDVIYTLKCFSKYKNVDMYILSACVHEEQARDKAIWLERNAKYFTPDKQIFVVKNTVKYDKDTKADIKTKNIDKVLTDKGYDYAIYVDDELQMLRVAKRRLLDKIFCMHISDFID